jgi:hypothetical protein
MLKDYFNLMKTQGDRKGDKLKCGSEFYEKCQVENKPNDCHLPNPKTLPFREGAGGRF